MRCMIYKNDKYYTIESGQVSESTLDRINSFDNSLLTADLLKQLAPCRLAYFDTDESFKNISFELNNFNSFILLDITNVELDNITFKDDHKMMVSDDMHTWYNYYNGKISSTIHVLKYDDEIENLKKCLRFESKPNNFIDKKYNYILLQLNSSESLDRILETLYVDYKRFDFETDVVYNSGLDKTITVTPNFNTKEIIVKLLPRDSIINQDSLGAW